MDYFIFLPDLRLLCCKTCRVMVIRSRICLHLRGRHHRLKKPEIDDACTWAAGLDIIATEDEMASIPLLRDTNPPLDVLGPPGRDGFRCTVNSACRFVGTDARRIREHVRKSHGVELDGRPGRRRVNTADLGIQTSYWRGGVSYQRLFAKGHCSEWFEVGRGLDIIPGPDAAAASGGSLAADFHAKGDLIRKREAEWVDNQGDLAVPNP